MNLAVKPIYVAVMRNVRIIYAAIRLINCMASTGELTTENGNRNLVPCSNFSKAGAVYNLWGNHERISSLIS